jgi:hypothetical protein
MYNFPRGYKQFKVLQFVNEKPRRYTEIIQYAYELSYGKGTFDKRNNRGYWSGIFRQQGQWSWSPTTSAWGVHLLQKGEGRIGKYTLSTEGVYKLRLLSQKFADRNIIDGYTVVERTLTSSPNVETKAEMDSPEEKFYKQSFAAECFRKQTGNPVEEIDHIYETTFKKLPLGVTPKYLYIETLIAEDASNRLADLSRAIREYAAGNHCIPSEWIEEYNELLSSIEPTHK